MFTRRPPHRSPHASSTSASLSDLFLHIPLLCRLSPHRFSALYKSLSVFVYLSAYLCKALPIFLCLYLSLYMFAYLSLSSPIFVYLCLSPISSPSCLSISFAYVSIPSAIFLNLFLYFYISAYLSLFLHCISWPSSFCVYLPAASLSYSNPLVYQFLSHCYSP